MIIDTLTEFCNGQALNTGGAGGYLIGDVVNLENARDIGSGQQVWLVIQVSTTATSGGSATGSFSLVSDASAAISPSGGTVHFTSPVFAVAAMTAGTILAVIALPREGNVYEQYVGIVQTTAAAAFTAGAIDAFLTLDPALWKAYPDGVN